MRSNDQRQSVIDEYAKQIANTIDMEAISKLTTSALSNESTPEIDGLVDRIVQIAESIHKSKERI